MGGNRIVQDKLPPAIICRALTRAGLSELIR